VARHLLAGDGYHENDFSLRKNATTKSATILSRIDLGGLLVLQIQDPLGVAPFNAALLVWLSST
jgi:hypothetical protein